MIRDDIKAATIAAMKGGDKETTGTLRLEGQVIDNREAPVENATVRITKGDYADEVASAADGTFAFDRLGAGYYYVSALKGDEFSSVTQLDLSPAATEGSGLAGMRDRIALLGGRLGVSSSVGRGTTVAAAVPCVWL